MKGLKAARLSERVVVTGGWGGGNYRDEVTFRFYQLSNILLTSLHVQVLQYEETAGTWSEIGKMKKARGFHAVVSPYCPGIVGQTNKKQIAITTIVTTIVYHLIITPTLSHDSSN